MGRVGAQVSRDHGGASSQREAVGRTSSLSMRSSRPAVSPPLLLLLPCTARARSHAARGAGEIRAERRDRHRDLARRAGAQHVHRLCGGERALLRRVLRCLLGVRVRVGAGAGVRVGAGAGARVGVRVRVRVRVSGQGRGLSITYGYSLYHIRTAVAAGGLTKAATRGTPQPARWGMTSGAMHTHTRTRTRTRTRTQG